MKANKPTAAFDLSEMSEMSFLYRKVRDPINHTMPPSLLLYYTSINW